MKSGAEVHFIAGQIFTLGVLAIAVVPRLPSDHHDGSGWGAIVGGKHSRNFRWALLLLVAFTTLRTVFFHLFRHVSSSGFLLVLDNVLGTVHVVGQSFLCLTTAYALQLQLVHVVNIDGRVPGRSLVPVLILVLALTVIASIGASAIHPNVWCLENLAEAASCWPVIQTLKQYTRVSFTNTNGRSTIFQGPVITQMLLVCEYYYLTTSLLCFVAEAFAARPDDEDNSLVADDTNNPLSLLSQAVRHNQDNGVDDWTRLLLHAVFQNGMDELRQVRSASPPSSADDATENGGSAAEEAPPDTTALVRRRG